MILEGIITTVAADGGMHLSAMGPVVDRSISKFELRPFPSSRTFQHLLRTRQAVFHVTDDVELLATIVAGGALPALKFVRGSAVDGYVLTEACRAYELNVVHEELSGQRGSLDCEIANVHRFRDFFGFNRAKHAVVEAAILATRLDFLPEAEIRTQWKWLSAMVNKTGGQAECRAFEILTAFVENRYSAPAT